MIFPRSLGIYGACEVVHQPHSTNNFLRESDLGVESWYAGELGEVAVVPLTQLAGHLILAPITVVDNDIWITVPYDHVHICILNV
jgi:hypothetical protein